MIQEKDTKPIVFFSWQSDISAKTNRNVISDCLRDICKKNNLSFDEATKNRCGSPDIASTIEEKIRSADIFIADATIINAETKSKSTPNPNVLFELGIAQAILGWNRIILIVNTAYAPISDLPFDIKSHRALNYSLSTQDAEDLSNKQKLMRIYDLL
jgi:predicted nucleotide-binding protein